MLKDTTYQEKFLSLKVWMPTITDDIKKDLKNEHLKRDISFSKSYFPGKNITKLTIGELAEGYLNAIETSEKAETIAEWLAQRWLLKKPDLYGFFEQKLTEINPQFDRIEEIEAGQAQSMIEEAIENFGAVQTYLFSVINAVAFSTKDLQDLSQRADREVTEKAQLQETQLEEKNLSKLIANYEQQITRMTDKYEKKLQGFERKYLIDTENLKKQIIHLQKRLQSHIN